MHSSSRHFSTETIRHSGLEFRVTRFEGEQSVRKSNKPILVLLHGFLGSSKQFSHLIPELSKVCRPVTVDIRPVSTEQTRPSELTEPSDPPKYSDAPHRLDTPQSLDTAARFDADSLVAGLRETLGRIRDGSGAPLALLGYSMGGRLALSLATRHPGSVDGLVLESTTAGIEAPEQRNERRASDRRKADLIRQDFGKFLEEWDRNPLFNPEQSVEPQTHPPRGEKPVPGDRIHPIDRLQRIQRRQDPEIMAKWLEEFGTGVMPPVWEHLGRIRVPVLIITGASDPKFCDLADRVKARLADARHVVIRGAAHRVHLDRPTDYVAALNDFLSKHFTSG